MPLEESHPAPEAPSLEAADLTTRLDKLVERIGALEQLFVQRIKDDRVQQQAFDSLHTELQQYRSDAARASQKPILKGMILMYDAALRMLETLPASKGTEAVEMLAEEIIELLRRHDVELIAEHPERFDNKIQMAIRTEPAKSEEEDQTVVQVVRQGFRWGGQVMRPQEVVVKVFKRA